MSEINEFKKLLTNHEKRISELESILKNSKSKKLNGSQRDSIPILFDKLKNDGFFDKPQFRKNIVEKLEESGHIYEGGSLNYALLHAVKSRQLGRKKVNGKWGYVKR